MKKLFFSFYTTITLLITCLISCTNPLLESPVVPTTGSLQAYESENQVVSIPQNITATNGTYKEITISWDFVANAKYYYIYGSPSLYSNFTQVGECNGQENSYTYSIASGKTMYFRVCAIGANNSISELSTIVQGSSLAQPIISLIEPVKDSEDSQVTIYWWMSNCTKSTYQDLVTYEVICQNEKSEIVSSQIIDTGSTQSTVISGLSPKTNYYYQVNANISFDGTKVFTESSDLIDSETSKRLIPEAPINTQATKGESINELKISFELPPFVDTFVSTAVYERHPVYFKIYRKTSSTDYTELISYFGSISSKVTDSNTQRCFADQTQSQTSDSSIEVSEIYPYYIPQSTVVFTDTSAKRGIEYTYKIVSYVDDITKEISSNFSYAETQGYLLGNATFSVNPVTFVLNETETAYEKGIITFDFSLVEGISSGNFLYKLNEHIQFINDGITAGSLTSDQDSTLTTFSSQTEINNYKKEVTLPDYRGKYSYDIQIYTKNSETNTEDILVDTVTSTQTRYVTEDLSPLIVDDPVIKDGFTDRFIITFTMHQDITYKIEQKTTLAGDWEEIETSLVYDSANPDTNITLTGYEPNQSRFFKITPYHTINGVQTSGQEFESEECFTLGKPTIEITSADYSSIGLKFTKAQKATKYELSYQYTDSSLNSSFTFEPLVFTQENFNEDGYINYSIDNLYGFDKADIAGLPISIILNVINEETENSGYGTNECIKETFLLGPAKTNLNVTQATKANCIQISWNKTENASGYLISRRYYDNITTDSTTYSDPIVYYVNTAGTCVKGNFNTNASTINLTTLTNPFVSISLSEDIFTLTDSSAASYTGTDLKESYLTEQKKIGWGITCEYMVFPINSEIDLVPIISIDNKSASFEISTAEADFSISYSNINNIKKEGYSVGYAKNVTATKGYQKNELESSDLAENTSIYVSWTKPQNLVNINPSYSIYRRKENSSEWIELTNSCTSTYYEDSCNAETNAVIPGTVYEYCIGITNQEKSNPTKDSLYLTTCKAIMDDVVLTECAFAGYVLPAVEIISASKDSSTGFYEEIKWNAKGVEDDTKTNRGINGYIIEVLNLNDSADWTIAETYTFDDSFSQNATAFIKQVSGDYLKILRDYKHYFRIRSFTNNDGKITLSKCPEYIWQDGYETNYVKWGTRQISDDEFIKAALLIYSDGFYRLSDDGNKLGSGDTDTTSGKVFTDSSLFDGSVYIKHKSLIETAFRYYMQDFAPKLATPAGIEKDVTTNTAPVKSMFTINVYQTTNKTDSEGAAGTISGGYCCTVNRSSTVSAGYAKEINSPVIIDIKPNLDSSCSSLESSYQGQINFTTSTTKDSLSLSYTHNLSDGTKSVSTQEERQKLLPVRFEDDDDWSFYSSDLDW